VSEPGQPGQDVRGGDEKATQVRWLIFGLACAVSWLLYLHRYAWGVIKPALKKEYPELDNEHLGYLDSLFQLTYAIGQVPGGLAGDVFGPRVVLSLSILFWSAAVAGLGWAGSLVGLGVVRGLFGLTQAPAYPALSKVTRGWFPLSIRTTVQGFVAALSGRVGGACASLIVATLLMGTLGFDWRTSLVVIGCSGVFLAVAVWLLFRNSPAEHPWTNQAEQALVSAGEVQSVGTGKPKVQFDPLTSLTLGAMLAFAFCSTFVDQLFVYWVPQFLVEGKGMDTVEMGLYASLPLWGGALGGAFGGVLNDTLIRATGSRRWGRTSVALTGKGLAAVLLAVAVTMPDGRAAALTLLACKFFGDWSLPTQWGSITDVGGRAAGTVFGVVNMVGAAAGILAGPIIGRIVKTQGWEVLFFFLAGVFMASALCWLLIDSNRRLVTETGQTSP
jgi:sugar phosphate permease